MDLGLTDRVYVVTGGSKGLGHATASALVAEGARVVITGRTEETVAASVADLGAVGVACDNADPATPARLIATAVETYGRLAGLLLSGGGPPPGTVTAATDEQWRDAFDSVFLGAVRLAREVAAALGD